jgi:hypothetical protein
MKTNQVSYRLVIFSALVLSMMIPFAGINLANGASTSDPYNLGNVDDRTYNETIAVQRAFQLSNLHDEEMQERQKLEQKLLSTTLPSESGTINQQINDLQGKIDSTTAEYNYIEDQQAKLYYIEPVTYNKYVTAKDNVISEIQKEYWNGKSFEDAKNSFPLVGGSIDLKTKSVEIFLSKDAQNSTKRDQYVNTITKLMPKDIPWRVGYMDWPTPISCSSRTASCNPLIGGIEIEVSGKGFPCTLGFAATRSGTYGWVDAGHCDAGEASGTAVTQPSTGSTAGHTVVNKWSGTTSCDCSFYSNSSRTMSDAIFQSSTSTYTPSTTTPASMQGGKQVEKSGITTGNTLGTVTSTSVTLTYSGVTVTNLVNASLNVDCGDSGSPVTNSFGGSLYGIAVAKNGGCGVTTNVAYWTPIDQITSQLGVTPILG